MSPHDKDSDADKEYNTSKWFTPPIATSDAATTIEERVVASHHQGNDDDCAFKSAVRQIKDSKRWLQRNGAFEGRQQGATDSEADSDTADTSCMSETAELCGAYIDVFWDQGAVGWYTAKVLSVDTVEEEEEKRPKKLFRRRRTLLTIVYDDGERDDLFCLHDWLWSVSARSSSWLLEYQQRKQNKGRGDDELHGKKE